jgi:hypothetical protein
VPKALAGVRFVDNGDGTVSDRHTRLVWDKKTGTVGTPNPSDVHDMNNTYTWSSGTAPDGTAYATFLATLNNCASPDGTTFTGGFAGYCDWRLPSSAELLELEAIREL